MRCNHVRFRVTLQASQGLPATKCLEHSNDIEVTGESIHNSNVKLELIKTIIALSVSSNVGTRVHEIHFDFMRLSLLKIEGKHSAV